MPTCGWLPYHSWEEAIRSRWLVRLCPMGFPIPFSEDVSPLQPHFLDFSMAPSDAVFLQGAPWFPTEQQSGGAVAVLDVASGHYTLHCIPIPIDCYNSYQAELYVASVGGPTISSSCSMVSS